MKTETRSVKTHPRTFTTNALLLVQESGDLGTLLICRRHGFAYLVRQKKGSVFVHLTNLRTIHLPMD